MAKGLSHSWDSAPTMNGTAQIFMPLLNDGTECWRPVAATPLGAELFRVESVCDDDEEWQFPSGSVVRCGPRTFSGGESGLAAFALFSIERGRIHDPKNGSISISFVRPVSGDRNERET